MNTAERRLGLRPARAICVWVPSPQSNSSHSASRATASALTLRFRVGLPELVPSGVIFISLYDTTVGASHRTVGVTLRQPRLGLTILTLIGNRDAVFRTADNPSWSFLRGSGSDNCKPPEC